MTERAAVFLTGGDGVGWALDEDLRLTRWALQGFAEFTNLERCQVVHCVWWEGLLALPRDRLAGKRVICHVPSEPYRYLEIPRHREAIAFVGLWIVRSTEGERQMTSLGLPCRLVPYTTDLNVFRKLPPENALVKELRQELSIPEGRYVIGNFHRDTEGGDLRQPKLVKGPDIFAEILRLLRKREHAIHALLAGPRRHWLRGELLRLGIPHSFVGRPCGEDDFHINALPRETLNVLYNLIDLYLVTSRSEGGPQSIMEASAARCKILSSRVGLAGDILADECLYSSPIEAVSMIERDIVEGWLDGFIQGHCDRVHHRHSPEAAIALFGKIYEHLDEVDICRSEERATEAHTPPREMRSSVVRPWWAGLRGRRPRVGIWHRFFKPPYGGGNQFMLALQQKLKKQGLILVRNPSRPGIRVHLLNSIHFDTTLFESLVDQESVRVVHRIDGPISLIRGHDREKDDLCFRLNSTYASATVLQSAWSYRRILEMGYKPVSPVIVHNAVDPDIFHSRGRLAFDPSRKVRLISTSWSDNPRKGGPIYKWIEAHMNWDRFDYTFVGRCSEKFSRVMHIPPVPSRRLAAILREHDIYITASSNDPCSNALVEALACGLPVLYLNDGGHPELVGYGGLPFDKPEEILDQLGVMVENYETFQRLIVVPSLEEVSKKYLTLIMDLFR